MNAGTNWNGMMGGLFLVSFFVAVPLAVPLLFLIRARVRRYMRERAASGAAAVPAAVVTAMAAPEAGAAPDELFARMRRARGAAVLLYAVAAIAAACIPAPALHRLWPGLLIVATVAVPSFRVRMMVLLAIYLALFGFRPETFGMYTLGPMLLLMLAVNRWLKTISLVLALAGFVLFGAMGGAMVLVPRFGDAGWLVGFGVLLVPGWLVLLFIVRAYERKVFSDASYPFAFLWLIFVPWWVYLDRAWRPAATALAVYALVTRLTLPLLQRAARRHRPVELLVLRTFGSAGRSRRLFDELGARWRYLGPLHLIAGADSATVNLDLSEAARYLTFRFRSLYVSGEADLERRIDSLDVAPDPDGRYRVNDFFCFDDTWQATVQRLLARSHAVLVDLSGYRPDHRGVQYELALLAAAGRLDSCVIVTDGSISAADVATLTGQPVRRVLIKPAPRALARALCDAAGGPPFRIRR